MNETDNNVAILLQRLSAEMPEARAILAPGEGRHKHMTFLELQTDSDEALKRRCDELGRDFDSVEISQQCIVVIAEDESSAKAAVEKAKKVYGGHMGAAIEEHGIWGAPDRVIECIERHRALGCTSFVIEFFGRDTREPARLFADKVAPAFRA